MKNRFARLLVLEFAAITTLILLMLPSKPDANGTLIIMSSIVIVSVVTLTGMIIVDSIEAAVKKSQPPSTTPSK